MVCTTGREEIDATSMNYCKVYELGLVGGEEFEHSKNGFGDTQRRE